MQRYSALWFFPVVSLAVVVYLTIQRAEVVDAPAEPPRTAATELAALAERNANLSGILAKSVEARGNLEEHVQALRRELLEMRTAKTALVAEAKLWRDSYDVLSARFDALAVAARAELVSDTAAVPASFKRAPQAAPQPSEVIVVR